MAWSQRTAKTSESDAQSSSTSVSPHYFDVDPNTFRSADDTPSSSRAASLVKAAVPHLYPIADRDTNTSVDHVKKNLGDTDVLFRFVSAAPSAHSVALSPSPRQMNILVHKSLNARRRRSRLLLRDNLPSPLKLDSGGLLPMGAQLVNKWDHYVSLYGSCRDRLCEFYGDPDSDFLIYSLWREAERPVTWWQAALVQRDPRTLASANCAALWFPLISCCSKASMVSISIYANSFSHLIDPPRTEEGRKLRRAMADGDLISGFCQELFDAVGMEIASEYRADMATALLFLVMEAFIGELVPPKYIVAMAAESIARSLDVRCVSVDQIVSAGAFRRALFTYLDRWMETAFVADWRSMLSSLLHAITPAFEVALRVTASELVRRTAVKHPPPQWEWALPFSRNGERYWIPFFEQTSHQLQQCWLRRVEQATCSIDADLFQELVSWPTMTIHRHDFLPIHIRTTDRSSEVLPSCDVQEQVEWVAIESNGNSVPQPISVPTHHWASDLHPIPNPREFMTRFSLLVEREESLKHPDSISPVDCDHLSQNCPNRPQHAVSGIVCTDTLPDIVSSMVASNSCQDLPHLKNSLRSRLQALGKGVSSTELIVHYSDGHCKAKIGIALTNFLRLIQDESVSSADALLTFGTLSAGDARPTRLDIQLMNDTPEKRSSDLGDASSYTFDVFLAGERAINGLLRPLLVTTGGVGFIRCLVGALKETATWISETPGCETKNVDKAIVRHRIASRSHVTIVVDSSACPPLVDSQTIPHIRTSQQQHQDKVSLGAALMLELSRLNPKCRIQLPLGGTRPRCTWPPEKTKRNVPNRLQPLDNPPHMCEPTTLRATVHNRTTRNPTFHFNSNSARLRRQADAPRSSSVPPISVEQSKENNFGTLICGGRRPQTELSVRQTNFDQ